MSTASSSPADLDISTPQRKDYLQTAISERGNPFRGFDWGDHLITVSCSYCIYAYWSDAPAPRKSFTRPNRIFKALLELLTFQRLEIQLRFRYSSERLE